MPQRFIIGTDDPAKLTLYASHAGYQTLPLAGQVRDDRNLAFTLEPVTKNLPGAIPVFLADFDPTDTFQVGIGIPDQIPTGGTFKLTVAGSTTNLTALAFDISAASLQTPFNVAMNAHVAPYPQATVTLVSSGVYRVVATTNGAIPTGTVVSDPTNLIPTCDVLINEVSLGSASTPYRLLIVVRQAPVAYAEPSTLLPSTGVTVTSEQTLSNAHNQIYRITFDNVDPVSGSFLVNGSANGLDKTCGAAAWDMSTTDFQTLLENHAKFYGNSKVTKAGSAFLVEFTNQLGPLQIDEITLANPTIVETVNTHNYSSGQSVEISGSNSTPTIDGTRVVTVIDENHFSIPVNVTTAGTTAIVIPDSAPLIAAIDIDLAAAQGVSGTIDLNTENLYEYSLTISAYTFPMEFMVRRTRASGEVSTIYGPASILISKDVLDEATLVPVPLPSYYTAVQSDARFGKVGSANAWAVIQDFQAGVTIETGNAAVSGAVITGFAGQTADLLIIQDSTITPLFVVGANGDVTIYGDGLANNAFSVVGLLSAAGGFAPNAIGTATSYTVLVSDVIIGVTSTASARVVTLPDATTLTPGQVYIVKDESGAAATNNITVKSAGGTIDGVAAGTGVPINTNYGALSFYVRNSKWYIF